jgi:3-oxoacyl-[acyl-carrier protein] reductase
MGGLNGLINNAGILRDGLLVKKDRATGEVTKLSKAQWDAVIAVNLTGATFMVREVVAKMARAGARPGVIVNMSSIARHGNRGQSTTPPPRPRSPPTPSPGRGSSPPSGSASARSPLA